MCQSGATCDRQSWKHCSTDLSAAMTTTTTTTTTTITTTTTNTTTTTTTFSLSSQLIVGAAATANWRHISSHKCYNILAENYTNINDSFHLTTTTTTTTTATTSSLWCVVLQGRYGVAGDIQAEDDPVRRRLHSGGCRRHDEDDRDLPLRRVEYRRNCRVQCRRDRRR